MKVLVCGSRGWHDEEAVRLALGSLITIAEGRGETLTVVHGHAPKGADRIADRIARSLGITVKREPAKWKQYGQGAGFIRNQKMLDDHPDIDSVYAFRSTGKSNGTDDMIQRAERAGKRVLIIND